MQKPDYHGGSIVNLMASLQQGLGGEAHVYPPLRHLPVAEVEGYRQVILWVIDGLGWQMLRQQPQAVHLNAALRERMTSVYPPTTASAVTTFLTGDAPQQHGLTGWFIHFRELGACLAVLPGRPRYGGVGYAQSGIDVAKLLGNRPFSERIARPARVLSPHTIAQSDFNRAHLGTARLSSYRGLDDLRDQLLRSMREEIPGYLFAYWPELDAIGHREGIASEQAVEHLLELDRVFAELSEAARTRDALLLVTADHGQIDTRSGDRLSLDAHPQLSQYLALPLCGEPRSAYAYLRPGCEAAFDGYLERHLSQVMESVPSQTLMDAGWFGLGEPHPELARRIGDRVLILKHHYSFRDWLAQERRFELVGVHGGVSQDEMLVPLIVVQGSR
ncbi:MAG: alkaline phosphatase family protein [Candidatus Thiodiazotropha sp.]